MIRTSRLSAISGLGHGTGVWTPTSFTVADNSVLVVKVYFMTNGGSSDVSAALTCAKNGGGATVTRRLYVGNANSYSIGCAIFTSEVTTGGTWQLDIDCGANDIYAYGVQVTEYVDYKVGDYIGATASDGNGGSNGAFATLTLSDTPLASSHIETICGTDSDGTGSGPLEGSGWTRLYRVGSETFGGGFGMAVKTGHTSTSVPWDDVADGASECYKSIGLALEIKAASGGSYSLAMGQGSYALTGQAVTTRLARKVAAAQGSYSLTGQAAGIRAARKLAAAQGSYALTGQSAALKVGRKIAVSQGAYALTGQAAGIRLARKLAAAQGSYALTGQSAALRLARRLAAAQGSYGLTGNAVALNYSGSGAKTLTADRGTYTLTGQSVSLTVSRRIASAQGAFALTGFATLLAASRRLAADFGAYTLTGNAVALTYAGTGVTPVYESEPRWRFVAPGAGRRVGLANGAPGARRIGGRSA